MGIAGSIVDQSFWENYLGIRVQAVDMTEVRRRMDQKIYDEAEFDLAMQWADAVFKFAEDKNRPDLKLDEAGRRRTFKESVLMAMIFRDMMQGNPKLKKSTAKKNPWATRPLPAASRASATGRTSTRTETLRKPCSTPPLTGTARAPRCPSPRKTTP